MIMATTAPQRYYEISWHPYISILLNLLISLEPKDFISELNFCHKITCIFCSWNMYIPSFWHSAVNIRLKIKNKNKLRNLHYCWQAKYSTFTATRLPSFLVNRFPSLATKRSFTLTKFLKVPTGNKLKGLSLVGK